MGQCSPDRVEPKVDCVQGCCVVAGGGGDEEQQATTARLRSRFTDALRSCKVRELDGPLELRFVFGESSIAWDDGRLVGFGQDAAACLEKVLPRLVNGERSQTGTAYDVTVTVQ